MGIESGYGKICVLKEQRSLKEEQRVVFVEAKVVTWCYHYLNELVHFGEQMDCELKGEMALLMIPRVERDGEEVEDARMGCAKMIR